MPETNKSAPPKALTSVEGADPRPTAAAQAGEHPDSRRADGPISQRAGGNQARTLDQTLQQFEGCVAGLARPDYLLRLFVSGNSFRSAAAIANVRSICDKYLAGRYELDVIDIFQQPDAVRLAQVVAVPTLIKELPFPQRRFVGDMSGTERIVVGLNLERGNGVD